MSVEIAALIIGFAVGCIFMTLMCSILLTEHIRKRIKRYGGHDLGCPGSANGEYCTCGFFEATHGRKPMGRRAWLEQRWGKEKADELIAEEHDA